jgi:hypothetical protein
MMKMRIVTFIILLVASFPVHSVLLIDPENLTSEEQKKALSVLKRNSWPTAILTEREKEPFEKFEAKVTNFKSDNIYVTPESQYVEEKITEELGKLIKVIQIPTTIWDLVMIKEYLSNTEFESKCEAIYSSRCREAKEEWCDQNYLGQCSRLFHTFSQFSTTEEAQEYTRKILDEIKEIKVEGPTFLFESVPQWNLTSLHARQIIEDTIRLEIEDQINGYARLFRATGGFIYKHDEDGLGPVLAQHPTLIKQSAGDEDIVNLFVSADYANNFIDRDSLENEKETTLSRLKEANNVEKKLEFYRNHRSFVPEQSRVKKSLDIAYRNLKPVCHIIDFPFEDSSSPTDLELSKDFILSGKVKSMSFGYSLLSGYIFDGFKARQSACPFVYATRDNDPYLYTLPIKLIDVIREGYSGSFKFPSTPLYQGIFDYGEYFHPRTVLELTSYNHQNKLDNIRKYNNAILRQSELLVFAKTPASMKENEAFVTALKERNSRVANQIEEIIESASLEELGEKH